MGSYQRAGEGIGSWGLVLRTAPLGIVKKDLRRFLFIVMKETLAREGWFFERRGKV